MEQRETHIRDFWNTEFYRGKKVLITGHTGFKGAWLCQMLLMQGAEVTGFALEPPDGENLFQMSGLADEMNSMIGDIRDLSRLKEIFKREKPEIVFHLAAQPIVRESYKNPVDTFETNVMGTVHVLECVRQTESVRSFLNVTTDKVYQNKEWEWGYREIDPLDGFDPYSNSKSCSELVTHSYQNSFFADGRAAISTARAGNVIGGGDFAADRIIPDCIRAALKKESIIVRNPHSIRPYQHVLEPLKAYLMIAAHQYEKIKYAGYYNVGPEETDCITTGELAELFCEQWKEGQTYQIQKEDGPHEATFLKLDCSKIRSVFGWRPVWRVRDAVEKTVEWAKVYAQNGDTTACMKEQIREFMGIGEEAKKTMSVVMRNEKERKKNV